MEERGDESLSSELAERVKLLSVESQGEGLSRESPPRSVEQDVSPGQRASQLLWDTGMLCEPIPNGFYSVVPVSSYYFSYYQEDTASNVNFYFYFCCRTRE